ncbi:GxxExxY protein [Thiohalophilus thiocyanatoxydans]|uniref:GxxExxY protein n=1 Tax=Thiohalophilus thiocyanatoxydans TaxID=381308 RepID=A0A4R8J306_9GAMM|nr:GxxExxY protein [Thiohalophilus thiocyanatoxydans]TDY04253.1 GxxExxY protein [Thiohalophilus thiocyanatoxydans]
MHENDLAGEIIGAAIEVHRILGPGLLESAYHECLKHELRIRGIGYESEVPIPLVYKGIVVDQVYRADFMVDNKVVVELKSLEEIKDIHKSQVLTYLKLTGRKLGLLINFRTSLIKNGIYRVANKL